MKIKNEEEYLALLERIEAKRAGAAPSAPERSLESIRGVKLKAKKSKNDAKEGEPAKRQGVKEAPILASLRSCSMEVEASPSHVTILFKGARLFTLNEIYALLQYRKYVVFDYKKQWHALVRQALASLGASQPHFDRPCKITLFRQGAKPVDRDSLMVMFKYLIDALKDEPKKGLVGIFPDDNPDIVYDDDKIQTRGEPLVGVRVDLIDPAPSDDGRSASSLFDHPQGRDLGAAPTPKPQPKPRPSKKTSAKPAQDPARSRDAPTAKRPSRAKKSELKAKGSQPADESL